MGTLTYDSTLTADFDDRVLAHLQIVINGKLRRNEAFAFSWKDDQRIGNGRTSIWLNSAIPISYKYLGGRMPLINPRWIEALVVAANSPGGLHLVPEPPENDHFEGHRGEGHRVEGHRTEGHRTEGHRVEE
ncbi:MAG: uncharacterized protein JWM49_2907 [Microbacteriaceae bacterium]|nr:uncharacterized protein [Microbacteriaceae bacterium]